ncbi:flagellar hook-basal body complex protein [Oxalobacteraceae bacterium]|nr:flagellar hook-basal body complex protein [Oxalobacteraceae bacterium]
MSFDIALSGIQAINEQLTTVSNNIANAGTYGFKSSRANFSSMYAGSQATGVEIGSLTQSIGLNGGVLNTGRSLDASINGRGFFISKDSTGLSTYSRVGIFNNDKNGFLIDSAGRKVQGYGLTPPSTVQGPLGDVTIPSGQIPAVATTGMDYVGNLSSSWLAPANAWTSPVAAGPGNVPPAIPADPASYNMSKVSVLYDSLGNQHTLTQYFVSGGPGSNTVTVQYAFDGNDMSAPLQMDFSTAGQLVNPVAPSSTTLNMAPPGADPMVVIVDYTGTTQFAGEATTATNAADGYASGTFTGVDLSSNGSVIAKYSNGQQQTVAMLALATFANEGALTPINDTSWTESIESGRPLDSTPGTGMAGALNASTLEQSNVDITSELVGLMTSQRNYQANSKVIQTESTMLQSLMQAI